MKQDREAYYKDKQGLQGYYKDSNENKAKKGTTKIIKTLIEARL